MPKARWLMEPTMPLKKDFSSAPVVRAADALPEIRASLRPDADHADRHHHYPRAVESDAENPAQHLGNQFRSDRLWCVPDGVRHDLYRHHCTRVQALPAGGGGAARQCCASTLCHPDCVAGGGTQIDHSRSVEHGCLPSAGARRSHPRAGRRLLAGARPRAAARNHRGGRRMRLHCKAVATKADKTSSNSKSQPDARKQVASKPTCTPVVGTFETCRGTLKMSAYRGRSEVVGARLE